MKLLQCQSDKLDDQVRQEIYLANSLLVNFQFEKFKIETELTDDPGHQYRDKIPGIDSEVKLLPVTPINLT